MRITLDTNQLVRALMRPPQLATFVMAWQSRRFSVVASQLLLDEYQKVIATALYGDVDYLVTADEDFTDPPVAAALAEGGISLITAQDFIRLLDR
jgi:predicted nucleic acid-binding protein